MEKTQESINKDLEELKNKHTETNNTITEIKNILEGISSRISEAEERISKLKDKMVEITSEEQNKVKRIKRTEDNLRDLWDNIKCTNIRITGVAKSWAQLNDFTFTFHFHALEKEMATHSSVLAWRIPGTGEPGGLPSLGSHRVRYD